MRFCIWLPFFSMASFAGKSTAGKEPMSLFFIVGNDLCVVPQAAEGTIRHATQIVLYFKFGEANHHDAKHLITWRSQSSLAPLGQS